MNPLSTNSRICTAVTAVLWLAACTPHPVSRPQVTRGDPIANVVKVQFESDEVGAGQVRVSYDGATQVIPSDGPSGLDHEVVLWLPSGQTSTLWAEVVTPDGALLESAKNRVRIAGAPKSVRWELVHSDPSRSEVAKGVVLVNSYDDKKSNVAVLDGKANILWWMKADEPSHELLRARPGRDDRSIVISRWKRRNTGPGDDGLISRLDLSRTQHRSDTRAVGFHHDWVELPNHRFAWLAWSKSEAVTVAGLGTIPVASDRVLVADEGSVEGQEEVLYDLLTDYPHDVYSPCGHMKRGGFAGADWWEWSHTNSIVYDEESDAIRMLVRYWNAVLEVGLDGELHWQAGGRHSDFALNTWFRHGHASDFSGDQMLVFNNGDHGPQPVVSDVRALDINYDTMEITEAWSWADPREERTFFLGDARKLPGGNVLVLFSPAGLLQEVTPEGEVVWEAVQKVPTTVGRVAFSATLRPH